MPTPCLSSSMVMVTIRTTRNTPYLKYEKQNFENGVVLEAHHLNHIEDGLEALRNGIRLTPSEKPSETASHTAPADSTSEAMTARLPWSRKRTVTSASISARSIVTVPTDTTISPSMTRASSEPTLTKNHFLFHAEQYKDNQNPICHLSQQ